MRVDVRAVLPPPNLGRFCTLADVTAADIDVVASGWTKLVLLTPSRAFLLPRFPDHVDPLLFEASVLSWLGVQQLAFVPSLFGHHDEPGVWPFPFLEIERMAGTPPAGDGTLEETIVLALMRSAGAALAEIHRLDATEAPGPLEPERLRHHAVDEDFAGRAADRIGAMIELPNGAAARWATAFAPLAELPPVFTHGEFGDTQLLHAAGTLRAVLDWDAAGVGPPLADLGFLEWDDWLWRRQRNFNAYRRELWAGYATDADLAGLADSFVALMAARDVAWHLDHPDPPHWIWRGTLGTALDVLHAADAALCDGA